MKIKLFCRSILYLFGTFLHEFSHFTVALVFGKPEGFSIVPRIEGDRLIFGEVKAKVRYKILSVFIATAPLIWWVFLFFIVKHFLSDHHVNHMQGVNIKMFMMNLKAFSFPDIFLLWIAFQLLWAGRLSIQDIKVCLKGFISPSGLMFILSAVLLWKFFR